MLRLGISRGELLGLRAEHIDLADPQRPVVYIYYDNPRWAGKERHLAADAEFTAIYEKFIDEYAPDGKLFAILPQSVNKIVERVVEAAGLNREDVTPQTLRDSYAVDQARAGADETPSDRPARPRRRSPQSPERRALPEAGGGTAVARSAE